MSTITHCWWQIIVAAIPYFALGAIWYNPKVLGSLWASGHGIEMNGEKKKEINMGTLFGKTFLLTILISAIVCWVCCQGTAAMCAEGATCSSSWCHCLACGAAVGVAIGAATSINYLYLMKPTRVFFIDAGYHLLGCILASIVLHALGCC